MTTDAWTPLPAVIPRRLTRVVRVGSVIIGGGQQISVQSMTTTDTRDRAGTLAQIRQLADAGCDIVRVAVPDADAAAALGELVPASPVPLVADIHFDYRLALAAVRHGVAKLRINPGNIGAAERVRAVAEAAGERGVPIRIGVNAGSLERGLVEEVEHGRMSLGAAMAESAVREAALLEECGFRDIVVSVKASQVPATIEAYRILAARCEYPLHIGVTETGAGARGLIKSAVGIGTLLAEGIGDTIRVSLTGPPVDEVVAGRRLLQALRLRAYGPEIVSCPTCGRAAYDVAAMVRELEERIEKDEQLRTLACTVAVMGCVVNGPGEARAADIGYAGGGAGQGMLFAKGQQLGPVQAGQAVDKLLEALHALATTRASSSPDTQL